MISLAAKPLLIAVAALSILFAGSAALNVRQWKEIGAAKADCREAILQTSANRSQVTTQLVEESLRHEVTALKEQINRGNQIYTALKSRDAQNTKLLNEYRKQVDANQDSSAPLSDAERQRLRQLETEYRIRSARANEA